jgi:hypothetical protein
MKKAWLSWLAAGLIVSGPAQAAQLITAEEAKLPPPKAAITLDRRGIFRSPKMEVISPNGAVHSPLRLQLKFESFGGATINPDSVR